MLKAAEIAVFWANDRDARKAYGEGPLTPALVRAVEKELGFRLPRAYVALMRRQNGGAPRRTAFPTRKPTSWAKDHIAITAFFGVGGKKPQSLLGTYGNRFLQQERGYPKFGICICDCPSAGHDLVMLDYRKGGPTGEPAVIHVDQELDHKITKLAPDFETFARGLVDPDVFHVDEDEPLEPDPAQQLKAALGLIRSEPFSTELRALLRRAKAPRRIEQALRRLLARLATAKGTLDFEDDPLSYLFYDVMFLLFTDVHAVRTPDDFLEPYGDLLEVGDTELQATNGHAPFFVEGWMRARRRNGQIVKRDGAWSMTARHRTSVETKLFGR